MAAAERKSELAKRKEEITESDMEESGDEDPLFEVETIIGKSKYKGQLMYKVRWKGYGQDDDTWEPEENLSSCQDLIEEYNERLCDVNRKRAEQRKMKRLEMEGRLSAESSDSSAESTSPYPTTFKNTFWKELEAGRVNVFESDMYSSVKKRSCQQGNNKQDKTSDGDSSPKVQKASSSSTNQTSASKSRRSAPPSKKTPPQSVKRDRSTSSSQSTSKSSAANKNQKSSSTSQRSCSTSQRSRSSSQRSRSPSKKRGTSSPRLDFRSVVVTTDSETETESKAPEESKVETSDRESDLELSKPSLNLVIKKVPQSPEDSSKQECSFVLQKPASEHSEDHNMEDTTALSQKSTSDSVRKDEAEHRKYGSKKKKKKKHKNSRSQRSDKTAGEAESARKRKVASTSLSSLPSESSLRCTSKFPKLDCSDQVVDKKKVEEHCLLNQTDSYKETREPCSEDITPKTSDVNINEPITPPAPSPTLQSSDRSTTRSIDSIENQPIISSESSVAITNDTKLSPSHDLIGQLSDRSQFKTEGGCSLMLWTDTSKGSSTVQEPPVPLFGDVFRNVSTPGKCEFERQDSETVDSGIASPASERSEQSGSRKVTNPPLDDLFGRTVLPLLSESEKPDSRGADQLEIDLDDVDWKMFDIDVKLEPVTLSNNDFTNAVMRGDSELVKGALLGNGKYDLERPDLSGKTLLMQAVDKMFDDIADLLINQGANIDAQMSTGHTPLMLACEHAEVATVNLLLELGAKVNLQCRNGESALMKAAKRGHSQIVWLLLECGANFNMVSNSGYTALSFVKLLRYEDTTSIIINHTQRVMSEFDKQVSLTLNNSAKILSMLFSPQVYNLCEGQKFQMVFKHSLQPPNPGVGYLLFIGHALFTSEEIKVRLFGACAVQEANLNGLTLSSLTKETTNFVLAFSPLSDGRNVLTINTVKAPDVKAKLIVCAYKAQLVQP